MRLTGLIGSETYQQLMADQITSVKFYAKEASGGTSQFVNLHPLTNTAWTEATVTWANIGEYDSSVNYGANMFNNQFTAFDITGLVKAWKAGTYSEDAGFILTHSDETKNKAIYSSEYGNAAFRPYVELTYIERGSGGGDTFAEATEVLENLRDDITIAYAHEPRYFYFTPTTTGFYTFESYDLDGDPYITLYNSNQQELKHLDDGQSQNFELCYHLIANTKYYFAVSAYDVHSFSLSITLNYSYFVPDVADFSWSSNNSVSTDVPYKVKTFKYRPSSDTTLVVFTQRSSGDPKLWIYDRNMDLLIQNDDGAGNRDARISYTFKKNTTYYVVAGHFGGNYGDFKISTLSTRSVSTTYDSFAIRNYETDMFIGTDILSSATLVYQQEVTPTANQIWKITVSGDYFLIQSVSGNDQFLGISSGTVGPDSICIYSTPSESTLWNIYFYNEYLIFEPKTAPGRLITSTSNLDNTSLELGYLSTYADNCLWSREPRSHTPLEGQQTNFWCYATAARMFVRHYHVSITASQSQSVAIAQDPLSVVGGNEDYAFKIINHYFSESDHIVPLLTVHRSLDMPQGSQCPRIYTEDILRQFLDDGHVLYISRSKYFNGIFHSSHASLICGYTWELIDGEICYSYLIYDPFPAVRPEEWGEQGYNSSGIIITETTGNAYFRSYNWICGVNQSPNEWDGYYWEGCIVPSMQYADQTILPFSPPFTNQNDNT